MAFCAVVPQNLQRIGQMIRLALVCPPWHSLLLVRLACPCLSRVVSIGWPSAVPPAAAPGRAAVVACWCALVLALCRPQLQEAPSFTTRPAGTSSVCGGSLRQHAQNQDMLDEEQYIASSAVCASR